VIGAGLCDRCAWQKLVRTGRGSVFSMCLRHKTDPRYAKYPPIPVVRCPGHEPRDER
jgi:hypothetical protein